MVCTFAVFLGDAWRHFHKYINYRCPYKTSIYYVWKVVAQYGNIDPSIKLPLELYLCNHFASIDSLCTSSLFKAQLLIYIVYNTVIAHTTTTITNINHLQLKAHNTVNLEDFIDFSPSWVIFLIYFNILSNSHIILFVKNGKYVIICFK